VAAFMGFNDIINCSIIIPHKNTPDLLQRCLDSIPSRNDIQIIVVDDNSDPDKVDFEHFPGLSDSHVEVVFTKEGKGAGYARNIGLAKAVGKWILFADADDYFIENWYATIEKYFASDYEVIFFTPTSIDEKTGLIGRRHISSTRIIDNYINCFFDKNNTKKANKIIKKAELELRYLFITPCSKLIKLDLIKNNKIKFDETFVSNDVTFSIKVGYYMINYHVLSDIIYCITVNIGTLTTTLSKENYYVRLYVFYDNYFFLKDKLNKMEFNLLRLNGRGFLIMALHYKLGLKKIFNLLLDMKKRHIRLFVFVTPTSFFKKIMLNYNNYKSKKQYYVYK
jgi:glycosyltransferase involved in cell wall biosynthesis